MSTAMRSPLAATDATSPPCIEPGSPGSPVEASGIRVSRPGKAEPRRGSGGVDIIPRVQVCGLTFANARLARLSRRTLRWCVATVLWIAVAQFGPVPWQAFSLELVLKNGGVIGLSLVIALLGYLSFWSSDRKMSFAFLFCSLMSCCGTTALATFNVGFWSVLEYTLDGCEPSAKPGEFAGECPFRATWAQECGSSHDCYESKFRELTEMDDAIIASLILNMPTIFMQVCGVLYSRRVFKETLKGRVFHLPPGRAVGEARLRQPP